MMVAEVAAATARTPRKVYREESVRTLFITWAAIENGRMRPFTTLLSAVFGDAAAASGETPPAGPQGKGDPLPGGRAAAAPANVKRAAKAALGSRPPSGGEILPDGTVRIHIDDPMARSAYLGRHPAQQARVRGKG